MADSPYIFDADETNFETAVVERSHQVPVVIDFWAPWCGPCRTLAPLLEKLIVKRNGAILLAKVNVDENPNLAGYFQIQGIPAVKAIRDGALVLQFEGLLPEADLDNFLDQLMPSAADQEVQAAVAKEKSAPGEAEAIYRKVLAGNSDHLAARLGLARVRLAAGAFDEVRTLLEVVPPGGDEGAEADRLRAECDLRGTGGVDLAALQKQVDADPENATKRCELGRQLSAAGRYPEALAMLYSAAERDRELARGPVKETMVQIFHAIGVRSDLADEYRDKLQRVLY